MQLSFTLQLRTEIELFQCSLVFKIFCFVKPPALQSMVALQDMVSMWFVEIWSHGCKHLECTSAKIPFALYYHSLQLCKTVHCHKTSPKVSGMFLLSLVTSESLMIVPSFRSVLKRNRPDSSSSSSSSSDSSFVSS